MWFIPSIRTQDFNDLNFLLPADIIPFICKNFQTDQFFEPIGHMPFHDERKTKPLEYMTFVLNGFIKYVLLVTEMLSMLVM